uniref:Uncharacterized protein n=1 Tax=Rhizophagus irregularis (strain DAOM 181602 / DAOM 197198 / MUCL 43194) TaxID=747089 RepID=U9T2I9_RHIID
MEEHAEGALSENTLSSEEFDPNQLEEDNGDVRFQELTAFSGSSSSTNPTPVLPKVEVPRRRRFFKSFWTGRVSSKDRRVEKWITITRIP